MSKYNYEGSEQFKPISAWGYVGYTILFCIPVIGWIFWLVCAFSSKNINRRSYARSFFCHFLLYVIIFVVLVALAHFNVGDIRRTLRQWNIPYFTEAVEQVDKWLPAKEKTSSKAAETKSTEKTTTKPVDEAKKEEPTATTAPKENPTKNTGSKTSGNTTGVRKEVKDAIDGYEEFFKEYADFMKKYSKSTNPMSMLADYSKMMTKYTENMEKWSRFEKDYKMNDAELKYYTDASLRIEKMLLEAVY